MYRIGVDLGGTNIVAAVVDDNYKIVSVAKRKTNCPRPAKEIVADIAAACVEAVEKINLKIEDIVSFGMGSPGAIDSKTGTVIYSNNLDFFNLPVAEMLKEILGVEFHIENDANAAAYGEFIAGAGKGYNSLVAITLGTGVGGGIIIDGKIVSGHNYAGAELGHMVISMNGQVCSCGRMGCWEAYASATALIRQTKAAMVKHSDSIMWELCEGNIERVSGRTAFDAMRRGDMAGRMVVDKYIEYISVGVVNCINIFQPEVLCIGGGISKEGDTLIKPILDFYKGENYARNVKNKAKITTAKLGNDAGIIGAAFLGTDK